MQRISDGNCHGRSAHCYGETAYGISLPCDLGNRLCQKADVKLGADRVDDRTDQQRTEESLCHGTQCIDQVTSDGYFDIFPFQKSFQSFFHFYSP